MRQADVRKEDYASLEGFQKAGTEICRPDSLGSDKVVTVYEFRFDAKTSKPSTAGENHKS